MILRVHSTRPRRLASTRGSILIIVMWVAFGLIALALYFAHAMTLELRASDNRAAGIEAEQAIEGAARYVSNVLATAQEPATLPNLLEYRSEAVAVGDAAFWLLGRGDRRITTDQPYFGLVDEAAKLNLNAPWLTVELLLNLPRMTPELAAAIIDWRDADGEVTPIGGAENETYQRQNPPYRCKDGPFESTDELRMVMGADLDLIYAEDANLNGVLDLNENDGDLSSPSDNRDGQLDVGLLEYFTAFSREPNLDPKGSNRVDVTTLTTAATREALETLLSDAGVAGAEEIIGRVTGAPLTSVLHFYMVSEMSPEDFARIETSLIATNAPYVEGLVNVNTASEAVLACIPGIGFDKAPSLIAYRLSNSDRLHSLAWVKEALDEESARQAGPYLTGHTYQISADIAAIGHHARGYRRSRFLFDLAEGSPRIRYREDLTALGWALGTQARQTYFAARGIR